jgi:hypothetical protein
MNPGHLETSVLVRLSIGTVSSTNRLMTLLDMQIAYISDLFRAPVHLHDAQVQQDMLPSPAISETLLFWMAACVGAGGILWTPCDDKIIS